MDFRQLFKDDPTLGDRFRLIRKRPESSIPILMCKIKLTWRCNLRCGICSLWHLPEPILDGRPPLTAERVDHILGGLIPLGLRKVHLSGGEILLRPDLDSLLAATNGKGLQVNVTTNGTLLDKEKARLLVNHRVHTAAFSIDDALEKKHDQMRGVDGAWRRTWKGIARLRERIQQKGRGPVLAVNTVVTRRNIERLPDLYQMLADGGVASWRLLPVRTTDPKIRPRPEQWTWLTGMFDLWEPLLTRRLVEAHTDKLARMAAKGKFAGRAMDEHPCYAPWFSLFVDADGEVFSCCTGRKEMPRYGNVTRDSLDDILQSRTRREVLASMASDHVYDICRTCDEFREENDIIAHACDEI